MRVALFWIVLVMWSQHILAQSACNTPSRLYVGNYDFANCTLGSTNVSITGNLTLNNVNTNWSTTRAANTKITNAKLGENTSVKVHITAPTLPLLLYAIKGQDCPIQLYAPTGNEIQFTFKHNSPHFGIFAKCQTITGSLPCPSSSGVYGKWKIIGKEDVTTSAAVVVAGCNGSSTSFNSSMTNLLELNQGQDGAGPGFNDACGSVCANGWNSLSLHFEYTSSSGTVYKWAKMSFKIADDGSGCNSAKPCSDYSANGTLRNSRIENKDLVSIEDLKTTVFPNPSSGNIGISLSEPCEMIEIYNATFMKIDWFTVENNIMVTRDLSFLPAGVYFLKILYKSQKNEIQKIIILLQ